MPCRAESIGYALALAVAVAVALALLGLDAKRTYTAAGELGVVALTGLGHVPCSNDPINLSLAVRRHLDERAMMKGVFGDVDALLDERQGKMFVMCHVWRARPSQ